VPAAAMAHPFCRYDYQRERAGFSDMMAPLPCLSPCWPPPLPATLLTARRTFVWQPLLVARGCRHARALPYRTGQLQSGCIARDALGPGFSPSPSPGPSPNTVGELLCRAANGGARALLFTHVATAAVPVPQHLVWPGSAPSADAHDAAELCGLGTSAEICLGQRAGNVLPFGRPTAAARPARPASRGFSPRTSSRQRVGASRHLHECGEGSGYLGSTCPCARPPGCLVPRQRCHVALPRGHVGLLPGVPNDALPSGLPCTVGDAAALCSWLSAPCPVGHQGRVHVCTVWACRCHGGTPHA
jgi:hypothetical protein